MTDPRDGRLNLRSLDAEHDQRRADAVMASVMARIAAPGPNADIILLQRYRRALVAAAAVLAAIATTLVFAPRRGTTSSGDVIATWTQSNHVPTNGELLAAYHGYRP